MKIKETTLFKSESAGGTSFGDGAKKRMGQKGTMSNGGVSLAKGDVLVFPVQLTYGWSKRFGGFVMVWLLREGKVAQAEPYQCFPGTLKRTVFPVEQDFEGRYISTGVRPTNTGTVVAEINKHGDYASAFDALAGKAVEVKSVQAHTVLRFGSRDETQERNTYELDIIPLDSKWKDLAEEK